MHMYMSVIKMEQASCFTAVLQFIEREVSSVVSAPVLRQY